MCYDGHKSLVWIEHIDASFLLEFYLGHRGRIERGAHRDIHIRIDYILQDYLELIILANAFAR